MGKRREEMKMGGMTHERREKVTVVARLMRKSGWWW